MPPSGIPMAQQRPQSGALLDDVLTVPNWYYAPPYNGTNARFRSYEFRASCAGTNIGGALAAGSATLFNEGRREGAVWIMVLLSDGAAGASNPISRIGTDYLSKADPYHITNSTLPPAPGQVFDPIRAPAVPIVGARRRLCGLRMHLACALMGQTAHRHSFFPPTVSPIAAISSRKCATSAGRFSVMPDAGAEFRRPELYQLLRCG